MSRAASNRKLVTLPERWEPAFWDDADGRCTLVKLIRQRYAKLKEDVGADSLQKDLLTQRAVFVAVQLETMERQAVDGGQIDAGVYGQLTNTLLGLLKALGLEKRIKNVRSLSAYLEERDSA